MNIQSMMDTAHAMVGADKGLLAMDESNDTCNKRFKEAGIAQTVEMRRAYRELLLTTPGIGDCINGAIMADETVRQSTLDGRPFVQVARNAGVIVGIKVDMSAKALAGFPGEVVTEGLDGLRERLHEYFALGARFAKWRGVIAVDDARLPTDTCIEVNAHALARYAALCQEAGIVPIVEPEVLMDGTHTIERCADVTERVQRRVFEHLTRQGVALEAMILKPNMVVAGLSCATQNTAAEVAAATLRTLMRNVPPAVPGVAFLSGGQNSELASSRLNAMHAKQPGSDESRALPWPVTFSYSRALQQTALDIWAGRDENRAAAQAAFMHRARCNCAAVKGEYTPSMEAAR